MDKRCSVAIDPLALIHHNHRVKGVAPPHTAAAACTLHTKSVMHAKRSCHARSPWLRPGGPHIFWKCQVFVLGRVAPISTLPTPTPPPAFMPRHILIDPSIAAVVLPCREKKKKKRKNKTRRAILRAGIGEEGLWDVETIGVEQREETRRVENLPNLTDSSTFVRDRREEDGLCLPEGRERT